MRKSSHIALGTLAAIAALLAPALAVPRQARAEEDHPKTSRLFIMPVADVVGSYRISLSLDLSLLDQPGILSAAGVAALGIGDLAQIEYRHTSAIGIGGGSAPLPAVGVQFKLPLPEGQYIPTLAIAYRLGVERSEDLRGRSYQERATDVFAVSKLSLPSGFGLHLGLRLSDASIQTKASAQGSSKAVQETLYLAAVGLEKTLANTTIIAELIQAPKFGVDAQGKPSIGRGVTGRVGLRWHMSPYFSLDASAGYLASDAATDASEVLAWDIRLGGEFFLSWSALACHATSLFCSKNK